MISEKSPLGNDGSIVDQDVKAPELLHRAGNHLVHLLRVADITSDGQGSAALFTNIFRDSLGFTCLHIGDRNISPLICKSKGNAAANSRSPTSDDSFLPF